MFTYSRVMNGACARTQRSFVMPGAGSALAFQCEQQVNKVLQEHNINQSDVKSVKVARRTGGAKSAGIYGLDAWVRLNSCSNGALVVGMTKYCMPQNVYTTGDCSVTNMPKY